MQWICYTIKEKFNIGIFVLWLWSTYNWIIVQIEEQKNQKPWVPDLYNDITVFNFKKPFELVVNWKFSYEKGKFFWSAVSWLDSTAILFFRSYCQILTIVCFSTIKW